MAIVKATTIPNHAKMMSGANRWIARGIKGRRSCSADGCSCGLQKQEVKELISWCAVFSVLTSPPTKMRQPMVPLSPCAAILPTDAAVVRGNSTDHGRLTSLSFSGHHLRRNS